MQPRCPSKLTAPYTTTCTHQDCREKKVYNHQGLDLCAVHLQERREWMVRYQARRAAIRAARKEAQQ